MKHVWTDNNEAIKQEIDRLIKEKVEIFCGRRDVKTARPLKVVKRTQSNGRDLFVLHHENEPTCGVDSCMFLYRHNGNSLRLFASPRLKKIEEFLAFELPKTVYCIHQRKYPRLNSPNTSSVVFSLQGKQRIYNGTIDNISLGGAKFIAQIPKQPNRGDRLVHLSLSLTVPSLSGKEISLHIPEAIISWAFFDEKGEQPSSMGVEFCHSDSYRADLERYIELMTLASHIKKD